MVILRLRRGGRRHSPHYRIVAQEKRSKLNGAYIESVGHYHSADKANPLVIDKDKVTAWLTQGATLSTTVNNLLVKEGILPKKNKISRVYSTKKADAKAEKDKPAEKTEAKTDEKVTEDKVAEKVEEAEEKVKPEKVADKPAEAVE